MTKASYCTQYKMATALTIQLLNIVLTNTCKEKQTDIAHR